MDPQSASNDLDPSHPVPAEALLRNADPPPLSEVLARHARPAGPDATESVEAALQARPRPDVYEPLAGPEPESSD